MALTVATYEQILTILNQLAENYTNLFDVYYEMFYDVNPQDVVLKIFDENGQQKTISLPNRAKDRTYMLNGNGDPNGVTSASRGSIYQDLTNGVLYINIDGTVNGWAKLVSTPELDQIIMQGPSSPEGNVTAGKGTLYSDTRKGMLYIKTTEAGNQGWINVSAAFEDIANNDLSNLTEEGESHFATPSLDNLSETGKNRFANLSLSNLNPTGKGKFDEKENLSNKTTSITSESTDTQYPTAKAVYDKVESIIPDLTDQEGKFLTNNGTELSWGEVEVETIPVGCIQYYGGSTRPDGWLICDGSAISREDYADLFTAIGVNFGAGDEATTFNLPNLIDKFPQGNTTVGLTKTAGLPNITGSIHICSDWGKRGTVSGAFSGSTGAGDRHGEGMSTGLNLNFNAQNSNSIYGNSTTVQPPAVTLLPIIKY